jgi:hypothetical protein
MSQRRRRRPDANSAAWRALRRMRVATAIAAIALLAFAAGAGADATSAAVSTGPSGQTLLDNARVLVQKFVIAPGQSTGVRPGAENRVGVFVRGGVLTSDASRRATLWRDGRVAWHAAGDTAEASRTNTGTSSIEFVRVTLKPVTTVGTPGATPKYRYLNYPNIPGEDLFENDFVIVQRFFVNPGQWEGVHAHHPDMLYIHVRGGQWAARSKREPEHPYPNPSADGSVGWMAPIDLSEGHESGNIGAQPIDLIWITLKK